MVMRINKMITYGKMLWSFINFSWLIPQENLLISLENFSMDIEAYSRVKLINKDERGGRAWKVDGANKGHSWEQLITMTTLWGAITRARSHC